MNQIRSALSLAVLWFVLPSTDLDAAIIDLSVDAPGQSLTTLIGPLDAPRPWIPGAPDSPANDHRGYVGGTLNTLDAFTLSITVDTAGVYRIFSGSKTDRFVESSIGPIDNIFWPLVNGAGRLDNATGSAWGSFNLEIVSAPSGGASLEGVMIGIDPGPGTGKGFNFARFPSDRQSIEVYSDVDRPYIDDGQSFQFSFDVRLEAGTTLIREYATPTSAVPEPSSVMMVGMAGLIAGGMRWGRGSCRRVNPGDSQLAGSGV
ncbi:hypothetical protein P12x_006077 (plasmid) [Tundrisphaera lichenicola]|uniref:hypothetical protein n=1 Tax=Tundrisphaera lichenicola TaxID=2029860 RepID=UPI003EB89AB2